jgi:hypothetical protein
MLFKLVNGLEKKHTHAGVLEFIAEEGRVYLPQWVNDERFIIFTTTNTYKDDGNIGH